MELLENKRVELLSPFAEVGGRGRPRKYPLTSMEVGSWFAIQFATPSKVAAVRGAVQNFRKRNPDKRFAVRYCHELETGTVVCLRIE